MSLSARIALPPSRRLALVESLVAAGGLVVACAASIARWPSWGVVVVLIAVAVGMALLLSRLRPRRSHATLVVSDRPEVGLVAPDAVDDASWQIADGTLVWPGFSVLVLESATGVRAWPMFDSDLRHDDRRALHRFLLWTLRGGSGRRATDG